MKQKDLNLLIGNSSVAHMGMIFLGIASLNIIGVTGAWSSWWRTVSSRR